MLAARTLIYRFHQILRPRYSRSDTTSLIMASRASSAFGLSLTRDDTYFFVPGGSGDLLWSDSSKIQIELTKVASEIEDPQAYLTCLDNLAKAFRKVMPQFKDQLVIAGVRYILLQ